MDPRAIYRYLLTQPAAFWFVNVYLFFEYVRPQSVWPSLDVFPWAQSAIILSLLALMMDGSKLSLPTVAGGTFIGFTAVLFMSCVTAYNPAVALARLPDYLTWVVIIFLIVNTVTTESRFGVFLLLFLLSSYKMSQFGFRQFVDRGAGFASWGATGAPGWFHNSGEFGIQMCVFIPMSVAYMASLSHRWGRGRRLFLLTFPLTGLVSIVATSSRGALIGIGLVAVWFVTFINRRQRIRGMLVVAVLGIGTWAIVPNESRDRFETAGDDETSDHRILRWGEGMEMARRFPVLGVGYENWTAYHVMHFPRGYDSLLAHNIFIQIMAELGYVGLTFFLLMIVATLWVNWKTRRLANRTPGDNRFLHAQAYGLDGALIGYLGSGFFITVAYYPYFWINLALTIALHRSMLDKARRTRKELARRSRLEPQVLAVQTVV